MTAYDEENFVSNSSITLETPEVQKLRPRISLVGVLVVWSFYQAYLAV